MTWPEFIVAAVSVPFIEKGRDYRGWDCWGMVRCGYRDVLGIEMPSWTDEYFSTREFRRLASLFEVHKDQMFESCPRDVGAIAHIYRRSLSIHVGIVMPKRMILHAEETVGTVQEPLPAFKIEGFYRRPSMHHNQLTTDPGDLRVVAAPHPFKVDTVDFNVPAGGTLEEILEVVQADAILRRHAHIFVGDYYVPRDAWGLVRPKPGVLVTVRVVPTGGGGKNPLRTILTIATITAALAFGGPLGAALVGGPRLLPCSAPRSRAAPSGAPSFWPAVRSSRT